MTVLQPTASLCWSSRMLTNLTSSTVRGRSIKSDSTTQRHERQLLARQQPAQSTDAERPLQAQVWPAITCQFQYSTFRVSSEATNYRLHVAGYSGNAGRDSFTYHNGMMFSTYDRDNDRISEHCALGQGGGFWYNGCQFCGVNDINRFDWAGLPGGQLLQTSRMWLQCK